MASGMNRLQQMKIFNMLTQSFNQYQLNQLSQLLYANQACVPEATPVPGFESRTAPSQFYNQREACYPGPTRKTFMDDLSDLDFSDVSTLFDGTGVDDEHLPDPDRMFECFDEEEGMYDACPLACVKEEAKSPSPCDSACSMQFNSPPYSPCMSDAEASIYSTDDGFHSDSSVDELFDAGGSPASFSDEAPSVDYSPPPKVKEECVPPPVPHKPTGRRKRGPKPPAMYSGNGPIQLWQFLLELIVSTDCKNLIRWTQEEDFEFKILKPTTVANLWGKRKNKPTMNYEKLSRGLRYYYGKSIIEKVHGKRYVYQFICNIPEILGYNPMDNKQDELVEDSVCGEPEMSPEVEDLLVTSSAVNDLLPESFDLSELLKL